MPSSYVVDMDGVIYHGHRLIPGALDFVGRLRAGGHKFLFLTNNSQWTPRDLCHRLDQIGSAVEETAITTLEISPSAPARRPLSGFWVGAVGSAITMEVMRGTALPSPAAGASGALGITVSQYHIAVQV